jgi:hypothetical protein
MKLKIFGPNLENQSKGQFVVHAADCADCKKLEKIGENLHVVEHNSFWDVSADLNSDLIREGSITADEGLMDIHFAPCVKFSN